MSNTLDTEVKELGRIADKPSLVALSYALRHPETWPEDFVWQYSDCGSCAMGLAVELWPHMELPFEQNAMKSYMAHELAMSYEWAAHIFFGLGEYRVIRPRGWFKKELKEWSLDNVTPDDVADAIDSYLADTP